VHPTQTIEIFGNVSTPISTLAIMTFPKNFTKIVPGKPLRQGKLNTRDVAEYSEFGPIERYISETVQAADL